MTFRLSQKPLEVTWPITVNMPTNGGKTTVHKFSLKWKVLDTAEFDKSLPRAMDFTDDKDKEPFVEFWSRIITGWKDIKGEKGDKDLPFNADNLKTLIRIPYIQSELLSTYKECIMGRQVKN
ncbi:hypothetical protein [Paremcibacter congregatus]|uniref:hypothetical protein n=1 Tax=Paremcibacter congregatus TaxID=2043170 RepID=UPI0030ED8B22|tara:strand:+ start:173 stop:538 length:366 start_codon:yes stop_codon:yes gene_type:complete